ncbi:Maintenance of telomere capping protein 6 [Dissostichus eleginoides]|uniref:Maintenance of telomere capping protein 6 n=1 Tax=Dissostichus eleginoides TaxID=100907 RepID=A0AAD9BIU5_DISEL|nr:Maintenance of telomere capping protein 6 [Dissostichus eleginoides]
MIRVTKALVDSEKKNKKLAAENASLREQTVSKELTWEEEKTKCKARKYFDSLVKSPQEPVKNSRKKKVKKKRWKSAP